MLESWNSAGLTDVCGGCEMLLGAPMGLTYFKRFRMEFDLTGPLLSLPDLPPDYQFVPWTNSLLDAHAETKYRSFCCELDANVFPCLGEFEGCRRLMGEISERNGFVKEATWLLEYRPADRSKTEFCGTIQGIRDRNFGAVQNVGVTPEHRGRGLGTCLLFRALAGFRQTGLMRAYLEVTAQNLGAVRLYQRLGFRTTKTVYKAVDVVYA